MDNNEMSKKPFLDGFFKFSSRGGSFKADVIAGIVTFLAMCYILPVNAGILSDAGMSQFGVYASTGLVSALACLIMGFVANAPIALSAGMGLNAFFTYTICLQLGYSWQEAMIVLFITGIIFFSFSLTPIRRKIIAAFPNDLKRIISAGLGAFIAFVGLNKSQIIISSPSTLVTLGSLSSPGVIICIAGVFLVFFLSNLKTKHTWINSLAVPMTMFLVAITGYIITCCGINDPTLPNIHINQNWGIHDYDKVIFFGFLDKSNSNSFLDMLGKIFSNPATYGIIFSLIFVNLFDTTATLMAVGRSTGVADENGNLTNNRAIMADAIGALVCAPLGTCTVTSFAESAIGVASGARAGLAAIVTGLLFLLSSFVYPVFELFTAPSVYGLALISVGGLIFSSNLAELNWKEVEIGFSAFVTIILIILTYSLTNGIGFGLLTYIVISLARGKGKQINWILYLITGFYILSFVINEIL